MFHYARKAATTSLKAEQLRPGPLSAPQDGLFTPARLAQCADEPHAQQVGVNPPLSHSQCFKTGLERAEGACCRQSKHLHFFEHGAPTKRKRRQQPASNICDRRRPFDPVQLVVLEPPRSSFTFRLGRRSQRRKAARLDARLWPARSRLPSRSPARALCARQKREGAYVHLVWWPIPNIRNIPA